MLLSGFALTVEKSIPSNIFRSIAYWITGAYHGKQIHRISSVCLMRVEIERMPSSTLILLLLRYDLVLKINLKKMLKIWDRSV